MYEILKEENVRTRILNHAQTVGVEVTLAYSMSPTIFAIFDTFEDKNLFELTWKPSQSPDDDVDLSVRNGGY